MVGINWNLIGNAGIFRLLYIYIIYICTYIIVHTLSPVIGHKHLRSRCGHCEGCLKADCGKCTECLDKKKFGGPGRKKKACSYRKCFGVTKQKNLHVQKSIDKLSSFADQYRKHKINIHCVQLN